MLKPLGIILCTIGIAGVPLVAAADDRADVMAIVQTYAVTMIGEDAGHGTCAERTAIIDASSPFTWTTCSEYAKSIADEGKSMGATDMAVRLQEPLHVNIRGGNAYVVVPATFVYKAKGKTAEENALWTLTLQETPQGWRITSWAWAQR